MHPISESICIVFTSSSNPAVLSPRLFRPSVIDKVSEMCIEAIPGSLIQINAILRVIEAGQMPSNAQLASLLVTALTTGYISATVSYE